MKYLKKIFKKPFIRKKAGISLIEMLVVLGIMSIVAITSISFYHQQLPSLKLRGEVRQLVSDLRYVQQLAVTEQVIYLIKIYPAENRYELRRAPEGRPETIVQERAIELPTRFLEITFADYEISFNIAGALRGDMGRVTLYNDTENNKRTITIMIRPSGHAQTIDNLIPPPDEPPTWPTGR